MKVSLIVLAVIAGVVVSFPTENPSDHLASGMSDLLASISKIQERVKGMRNLASGNHTSLDEEVMEGVNSVTKNVTYENLIDRVELARKKVKELQQRLSGVLKGLDKNYARPADKTEQPAAAA